MYKWNLQPSRYTDAISHEFHKNGKTYQNTNNMSLSGMKKLLMWPLKKSRKLLESGFPDQYFWSCMLDCRDTFSTVFIAQPYCNACKAVYKREICGQTFSRHRRLAPRSLQSKTPYWCSLPSRKRNEQFAGPTLRTPDDTLAVYLPSHGPSSPKTKAQPHEQPQARSDWRWHANSKLPWQDRWTIFFFRILFGQKVIFLDMSAWDILYYSVIVEILILLLFIIS